MCIKCEAQKLALGLMGKEVRETVLGTVSPGLILGISLAENEMDKVKADLDAEIELLEKEGASKEEVLDKLAPKYEAAFTAAKDTEKNAWDEVFKSLGTEGVSGANYRINQATNEVTLVEIVDKTEAPTAEGVH